MARATELKFGPITPSLNNDGISKECIRIFG